MEADGWKVLLVSTRRSGETWVFPKGCIGRDERPKEAAVREAREEAGVTGTVGPKLGPFEIKAGHQVQKMWILFVDTVLGDDDPAWEERGIRERRWCAIEDAPKLLNPEKPKGRHRPELLAMLEAATAAIGGPSTDAASLSEVEAAETAAATAVASGVPTSCADCVGQASGCGGGGCTLTAGGSGGDGSDGGAKSVPPVGQTPSAQDGKCQPPGWSSVGPQPVCLQ
ncbi:hypothetical protein MMPV_009657 [Pyropia vietnamensis]